MMKKEQQSELKDKIVVGLEKVYDKLIEYKKAKNSELGIMKEGKIVRVKPK